MEFMPVSGGQSSATKEQGRTGSSGVLVDFDQFLNLFVSQLKYQDPLNPAGGEEFLAQTAQFTSVEQLVNLNQKAGAAADTLGMFGQASAAALIGRTAQARTADESGVERDVTGRVVRVDYGQQGKLFVGLEDGTTVPFSDIVTVSET